MNRSSDKPPAEALTQFIHRKCEPTSSASTKRIQKYSMAAMSSITPSDIFDRLAAEPESVRSTLMQFRSRACAQQYRLPYEYTQRFLHPASHVLDWGCGNGHFSYFLNTVGHAVESYAFGDASKMIQHLEFQGSYPLHYTAGSEEDPVCIPYGDGAMAAVFSIGVLEHVREVGGNERDSLLEIHRILQPSGLFFCFHLPNRLSWIECLTSVFRSRFHHIYKYNRPQICALLHDCGFEPLVISRYNALPRNIFSSLPWARRSRLLACSVDLLDSVLTFLLNPFCQNYAIVARKTKPR